MAGTWRISRTCYSRRVSPWASLFRFGGRGRIRRGLSSTRGIRCGRRIPPPCTSRTSPTWSHLRPQCLSAFCSPSGTLIALTSSPLACLLPCGTLQTRVSTWDAQSQSFRACAHALPSPHLAPKYIIREALEQQEQHLLQCHSAEDPLRCTAAIAATYKLHAHGQQLHGGWPSLYPWRFDSRLVPLLGGTPLRSVPNRSTDGTVDSFESNLDHGAHRCPPGSQGRWLSSEARREPGLDPAKEGAAALRGDQMHWVPWGCRASSACFDGLAIRTCLGRRRLVLLGDSVSAGTFLDICSALGGGKQCAAFNWATGTLPPQAVVAFSPSTGLPPRQGLLNLFGSTDPDGEVLERLLTRANNTIVVFQSGLHDISTLGGSHVRHRIAPLLTYQYHLRKLARVLSTVRQRNPTATFVWKQTTYPRAFTSPLQADLRDYPERALNSSRGSVDKAEAAAAARAARTSVSLCRDSAFPATYTPLIEKLNQAARELFAPMGVLIWEEPALMTFTAPGGWIVARHGRVAGQQAPACTQPAYAPATALVAVPTTAPLRPACRTRARPRTPVDGLCADHLMPCPRHVLPQGPYALRRVRGRGGEI
jgi:hypothetical protein